MKKTCRREFLKKALIGSAAVVSVGSFFFNSRVLLGGGISPSASYALNTFSYSGKEAMFYRAVDNNRVQCQLCPHKCTLRNGSSGLCRVRKNIAGKLYSQAYGNPCSVNVGLIEKAPLHHFIPGHERLCVATVGCNLRCKYCHNWQISQRSPGEIREYNMTPEDIVKEALIQEVMSISFTYTEPTIFYEYMYDISRIAKNNGLKVSIVSNGYINPQPLRKLLPYLDAVKIDLKAFSDDFYREICSAKLDPVLQTLLVLKDEGMLFEIVNLVVPTLNDNPDEIKQMCVWINENLGAEVPVHFNRFSPSYKLTELPTTPINTLESAVRIANESGLKYVYMGNVPGHKNNSTFCPNCGERLIHRVHYSVRSRNLKNGNCKFCGYNIHGRWEA